MIRALSIIVLFVFAQFSFSEEISEEKKRVIDKMLKITGALKIGELMGTAIANQMITAMSQQHKDLDPKAVEIVRDEVGKIMHDQFIASRFVNEISYTIYHKYFTTAELKEMVAFYKTPTGSKMAALLPQVTQEGMLAGQQHGQSLGPIIQKRIMERFEEEGIE